MNLPNKISVFRILLVPIIFILIIISQINIIKNIYIHIGDGYKLPIALFVSGMLFIIAALSDFLDGYIARKYDLVTSSGKLLDAVADKILTNAVLIGFLYINIIPVWIVFILIIRDFCVDALRLVLSSSKERKILPAGKLGKYKSALIFIGLSILFFINKNAFNFDYKHFAEHIYDQIIWLPMYVACILSIISGFLYFKGNLSVLKSD